jgi:hypothetical protein
MEECIPEEGPIKVKRVYTDHAAPIILWIRIRCYSLEYKFYLVRQTQYVHPHTYTTSGEPGGAPQD